MSEDYNEKKVLEQLVKGENFALLLRDGIFNQAITEAKLTLFEQICGTDADDGETREHCYVLIKALQEIESAITSTVSNAIALQEDIDNNIDNDDEEL